MGSNYINPCEEVRNAESGIIQMVTVKVRYYSSEGKCLGVIGTGICISPKYLKEKNTTSNIKNGIFQLGEEFHNKYLTKRELDVLKSVLLRHTSKIIARILKISPRTVECYIAILKDKLQCSSKAEIISKAVTMKMYYLIHEIF